MTKEQAHKKIQDMIDNLKNPPYGKPKKTMGERKALVIGYMSAVQHYGHLTDEESMRFTDQLWEIPD